MKMINKAIDIIDIKDILRYIKDIIDIDIKAEESDLLLNKQGFCFTGKAF